MKSEEKKSVACFYEYMDNFLVRKNNDGLYDIVVFETTRGEDDLTLLVRESRSLGFGNLNNFRRKAADDTATYYASLLRAPVKLKDSEYITPAEAEHMALRPGLIGMIRRVYPNHNQ